MCFSDRISVYVCFQVLILTKWQGNWCRMPRLIHLVCLWLHWQMRLHCRRQCILLQGSREDMWIRLSRSDWRWEATSVSPLPCCTGFHRCWVPPWLACSWESPLLVRLITKSTFSLLSSFWLSSYDCAARSDPCNSGGNDRVRSIRIRGRPDIRTCVHGLRCRWPEARPTGIHRTPCHRANRGSQCAGGRPIHGRVYEPGILIRVSPSWRHLQEPGGLLGGTLDWWRTGWAAVWKCGFPSSRHCNFSSWGVKVAINYLFQFLFSFFFFPFLLNSSAMKFICM